MRYEELRQAVWRANMEIVDAGLVEVTWGNASGVDREAGVMVIKPSGVPFNAMRPEHMTIQCLSSGEVLGGSLRPSTDSPTHRALYHAFGSIGGIVHTHSPYATSWAQAVKALPCLGTTHADHFRGAVPITRSMRDTEIASGYELNTGAVIIECFAKNRIDPLQVPGVLVAHHGPFTWGSDPTEAAVNATVLESLARNAVYTLAINPAAEQPGRELLDKHFFRKHGPGAYYGQDAVNQTSS